jgi:hypothetical protein
MPSFAAGTKANFFNLEYARAVLGSDSVLKQQAAKVFKEYDVDANGQIDRDELSALYETFHAMLRLPMPSYVDLGREVAKFDASLSGGLDKDEFIGMFKHLLQASIAEQAELPTRRTSKRKSSVASSGDLSVPSEGLPETASFSASDALDPDRFICKSLPNSRKGSAWSVPSDTIFDDHEMRIMSTVEACWIPGARIDEKPRLRGELPHNRLLDSAKPVLLAAPCYKEALPMISPGSGVIASHFMARNETVSVGDEVWAPFFGDTSERKYRAVVRDLVDCNFGPGVSLRWLRPPEGTNPDQYVCGCGMDDTLFTVVPIEAVAVAKTRL